MEKKLSLGVFFSFKKRPSGLGFLVCLWFQQCGLPLLSIWDLGRLTEWCSVAAHLAFSPHSIYGPRGHQHRTPLKSAAPMPWCIYKHLSAKYLINQPFKGAANLASCQHPSHHKPHFSRTAFSDRAFSWMSFKVTRPCFPEHVVNACGHLS